MGPPLFLSQHWPVEPLWKIPWQPAVLVQLDAQAAISMDLGYPLIVLPTQSEVPAALYPEGHGAGGTGVGAGVVGDGVGA